MQIVSYGDDLHAILGDNLLKISKPIFWENLREIRNKFNTRQTGGILFPETRLWDFMQSPEETICIKPQSLLSGKLYDIDIDIDILFYVEYC